MSLQRKIGYVLWIAGIILLSHMNTREFWGLMFMYVAIDLWKVDKR